MKAGFVALLGLPNSGKSTLANALVGEKISIVSAKPQTTRRRIHGILTTPTAQLVFVDAPGVVGPTTSLNEFLHREYQAVLRDSDVVMVIVNLDATSPGFIDRLAETAREAKKPWIVVATKSDLTEAQRTDYVRAKFAIEQIPVAVVSAEKDPAHACAEILPLIEPLLPEAPAPLYDADEYTTENMRQLAAEWIREQAFEHLAQEIPYSLAVRVTSFSEADSGPIRIHADLLVEKDNHKVIVIGKGGQMIKAIGIAARAQLEKLLGRQVYLELHVVVRPSWTKNLRLMQELGYAVPH